jgi:hypothetical protein
MLPMFVCLPIFLKLKLTNIVGTKHFEINHSQQPWKKRVSLSRSVITTFFSSTNPNKHDDEAQQ